MTGTSDFEPPTDTGITPSRPVPGDGREVHDAIEYSCPWIRPPNRERLGGKAADGVRD